MLGNTHVFLSLAQLQACLDRWREDYNRVRPHIALGDRAPGEFAADWNQPHCWRFSVESLETRPAAKDGLFRHAKAKNSDFPRYKDGWRFKCGKARIMIGPETGRRSQWPTMNAKQS